MYLDFSVSKLFDSSRLNFGIDLSSSSISSNNLGKHNRFTSSLYADYTFKTIDNKLSFSPGFSVSNFSDMSTHFFPGIDIGFDLSEKIDLYANYGKTYRIPTYTDLYYSDRNTIGNPNLNPEHAITNEIGIKYSNENIDIKDTVIVEQGDIRFEKSEAVGILLEKINFKYTYLIVNIFPKFFRNLVYDFIDRYRYNIFGKIK